MHIYRVFLKRLGQMFLYFIKDTDASLFKQVIEQSMEKKLP